MTLAELAERVGATAQTLRKVERGDPTVSLGIAFEAAAVLGVPLFSPDDDRRRLEVDLVENRLAVLPKQVRRSQRTRDDF